MDNLEQLVGRSREQVVSIDKEGFLRNIKNTQYANYYEIINEIFDSTMTKDDCTHLWIDIEREIGNDNPEHYLVVQGNDGGLREKDIEGLTTFTKSSGENTSFFGLGAKVSSSYLANDVNKDHKNKGKFFTVSKIRERYNGIYWNWNWDEETEAVSIILSHDESKKIFDKYDKSDKLDSTIWIVPIKKSFEIESIKNEVKLKFSKKIYENKKKIFLGKTKKQLFIKNNIFPIKKEQNVWRKATKNNTSFKYIFNGDKILNVKVGYLYKNIKGKERHNKNITIVNENIYYYKEKGDKVEELTKDYTKNYNVKNQNEFDVYVKILNHKEQKEISNEYGLSKDQKLKSKYMYNGIFLSNKSYPFPGSRGTGSEADQGMLIIFDFKDDAIRGDNALVTLDRNKSKNITDKRRFNKGVKQVISHVIKKYIREEINKQKEIDNSINSNSCSSTNIDLSDSSVPSSPSNLIFKNKIYKPMEEEECGFVYSTFYAENNNTNEVAWKYGKTNNEKNPMKRIVEPRKKNLKKLKKTDPSWTEHLTIGTKILKTKNCDEYEAYMKCIINELLREEKFKEVKKIIAPGAHTSERFSGPKLTMLIFNSEVWNKVSEREIEDYKKSL